MLETSREYLNCPPMSAQSARWQLYDSSGAFEPDVRNRTRREIARTSGSRHWSMIPKSGYRFSEKIMLQ
jgi:hypothetical protein